jgi:tetratricopeptide (TPR) repeat protein
MPELTGTRSTARGPEAEGRRAAAAAAATYAEARKAFAREDWAEGVAKFHAAATTDSRPIARDRLLFDIAKIRIADTDQAISRLDTGLIREAEGEAAVRRHLVRHFHRSGRLQATVAVLEKLLEAYPDLFDMRRLLASVLARLSRWDEAIVQIDAAAAGAPDDVSLQAMRVQYRYSAREMAAAAEIARNLKTRIRPRSREAHVVMMALLRGGYVKDAAEIAAALDPADLPAPHVAAIATEALVSAGLTRQAIAMGEAAIAAGHDSGVLRAHLGEAILMGGRTPDIASQGVAHLRAGAEKEPDHGRINALYGEALLRAGRHADAITPLEKAVASGMGSPKTRSLYARALRYDGRYTECADQYVELLTHAPENWPVHRQAVGALRQAGRAEDASRVFKAMIAKRSAALSPTFEEALAALDGKLDSVRVPPARLDWAWRLRRRNDMDRSAWERRAKWGLLADLLIIDWLECREPQAEEAMSVLADLGPTADTLEPYRGQGFIIGTAHVGPMFAGPILLELLNMPSRWVASTPSIADAHYAASVISTSDQTDSQVARACLKALHANYAVAIAVDGSGRIGSPTVRFEGQDIAYSSFAARAAYRAGVQSLFYAPRWRDGRIETVFQPLPFPEPEEDIASFAGRWRDAYLACLRACLADAPENLRLAGGLWSCIRPVS